MAFKCLAVKGDRIECDACGYPAPLDEFDHPDVRKRGEKVKLCEVCAKTACGNPLLMYRDSDGLFRAIAQVANLVLDRVDPKRYE